MIENAAHNGEAFIWFWFRIAIFRSEVAVCLKIEILFKVIPWEVVRFDGLTP